MPENNPPIPPNSEFFVQDKRMGLSFRDWDRLVSLECVMIGMGMELMRKIIAAVAEVEWRKRLEYLQRVCSIGEPCGDCPLDPCNKNEAKSAIIAWCKWGERSEEDA